jgi:BolA family transcriptional regulator, general stress-responsive regulator
MGMEDTIRERLAGLRPESLEVYDDSHEHAGHVGAQGGGGHYQLVIVSREFAGKPAVMRHRLIYQALGDLMPARIHALAIRAYTPEEMGASAEG